MGYAEAQYAADTAIKGIGVLIPDLSFNSKLVCRSSIEEDAGKLVTVSDGTNAWSKNLSSNLEAAFDLPGKARYTITVSSSGIVEFTKKVDLSAGEYMEVEVGLNTKTWTGLKNILNAHLEGTYCTIGDEIVETLNTGEQLVYRIAAIDHDADHQLIFETRYCMETARQMNPTDTNAGGWNACTLREWLNGSFYNSLSEELKSVITERTFKSSIGSQQTALQSATDKIWLPREWEIFGTTTYAAATEHSQGGAAQFPIYAVAANRVKTFGKNGGSAHWWLSSPSASNSTSFCHVYTSGGAGSYDASHARGVVPCFQIVSSES